MHRARPQFIEEPDLSASVIGAVASWKCRASTGFRRPRQAVWEALNDPAVLKDCIPGCESLEKVSDTEMTATVVAKVGPVKATFKGHVTLSNLKPPDVLHDHRRGQGRCRRLRQGRGRRRALRRRRRHAARLHRQGAGRRQACPDRRATDRRDGEADGRPVLRRLRRKAGWRRRPSRRFDRRSGRSPT